LHIEFNEDNLVGSVTISLYKQDYELAFLNKLREYSKKIKLKGFRDGSVPVNLVKQMYGRGILFEQLSNMVGELLTNYIKDNNINLVSSPVFESTDFEEKTALDADYNFTYKFGIVGEFALNDVLDIEVDKYVISSVEDAFLADYISAMLLDYSAKEPESVASEHALITGNLLLSDKVPGLKFSLYIDSLADASKADFIGCKTGDKLKFSVKKCLANKMALLACISNLRSKGLDEAAEYEFVVESVFKVIPAELNQVFFDKAAKFFNVSSISSTEEFHDIVSNKLIEAKSKDADELLSNSIKEKIVSKANFGLPDDFIKKAVLKINDTNPAEGAAYYESYINQLKWRCVCDEICKVYNIEVSDDEVYDFMRGVLKSGADSNSIDSKIYEFLKIDNNYQKLHSSLLESKILEVIKKEIKIIDKNVSLEEFNSLVYKIL
jgi:trigger factor